MAGERVTKTYSFLSLNLEKKIVLLTEFYVRNWEIEKMLVILSINQGFEKHRKVRPLSVTFTSYDCVTNSSYNFQITDKPCCIIHSFILIIYSSDYVNTVISGGISVVRIKYQTKHIK